MALRYLAGRIGIPAALRRASGSRLAQPSGASRCLSSSSQQGGYDNGPRKPMPDADVARLQAEFLAECEAIRETMKKVASRQAEFAAECEAVMEAMKKEEADSRLLMKSCLAGVGAGLLVIWYSTYTAMQRLKHLKAMLE